MSKTLKPKWLCKVDADFKPVRWLAYTDILAKRTDCFPVAKKGDRPDMTSMVSDEASTEQLATLEGEVATLNDSLVAEQDRADKAEAALVQSKEGHAETATQLNEALKELQDARNIVATLEDSLGEATGGEEVVTTQAKKPAAKSTSRSTTAKKNDNN